MSEPTVGRWVEHLKSVAPNSVALDGKRWTYLGEISLDEWEDGTASRAPQGPPLRWDSTVTKRLES